MRSYESSKWYVKIWRWRWYFTIPFIFIKINKKIKIDFLLFGFTSNNRKKLINSWFDIKKHVELTKMSKYS